jgi:hypothetical protein
VGLSRLNIYTPIRWIWYDLDTGNHRSVSILPLCLPREGEATMTETIPGWWENPKELSRFAEWFQRRFGFLDICDVLHYLDDTEKWMIQTSHDEDIPLWSEYQAEQDIPL